MGRGPRDIIRETPQYVHLLYKYMGYKLFNIKSPFFGSVDVVNVCNLHCTHCYWWLSRKDEETELSLDQWKEIIDKKFKKKHVYMITLVGGEPLLKPDVVELFAKEFPKRLCVVTNGTFEIPKNDNVYFYWISIDGTQSIHDKIRGIGTWKKTRDNVLNYVNNNGPKAWKDIWISVTINSQNYHTALKVIDDWMPHTNKIGFQFYTPFVKNDPLWLPFGKERTELVDSIISLKKKNKEYNNYIANPVSHLELMKQSWGGSGTTPVDCPTWAIVSVDHMGREKLPCCIGSSPTEDKQQQENEVQWPRCEDCGVGCYSMLVGYGIKG